MSNLNGQDVAAETKPEHRGWIGVDLDGTLAKYDGWKGPEHIGDPVPEMVRKVKAMLAEGRDVRIFTARISPHWFAASGDISDETAQVPESPERIAFLIREWCRQHIGQVLDVTCRKDFGMVELYDDRCVYVFPNQGITHREHQGFLQAAFVEVASALGVRVENGSNFKEIADYCAFRARVCVTSADKYESVLALFDGAEDSLRHFLKQLNSDGDIPSRNLNTADLDRTLQTLNRALKTLRELAGKKG
jgi:hypothetical protein